MDSGKSTTTGRLLFELGGIPERELEKLKEEAAALGKQVCTCGCWQGQGALGRETLGWPAKAEC